MLGCVFIPSEMTGYYITLDLGLTAQRGCTWEALTNVSNVDYTDLSHSSLKICPHSLWSLNKPLLNVQSLMGHEVASHYLGLITCNLKMRCTCMHYRFDLFICC